MEEQEKQEGQKTVVAFIAGLLIGGLLVWVFSASPEDTATETNTNDDTTEQTTTNNNDTNVGDTDQSDTSPSDTTQTNTDASDSNDSTSQPEIVGEGDIDVSDQGAGPVVVLDDVSYPTNNGWVVVRDYVDGTPGSILGAARYSVNVGLTPTSVNLLRSTEADSDYQVVFYSENGDRVFDLEDDVEIQGYSATFTAQ